jgi:hypothetical protein
MLRKTFFSPPNMVHTNTLRQYILSCLVALLLYIKVINIINNNNMSSTTPTLIGTGGKTVGATRFNVSARAKVLAEAMSVVCKQADRLALSSADKEKIHTKAVAGLDPKFSILQTYDGEEQLELTHSLSIQFILLEQRLKKFDMIDVFTIQLYGPSDPTDIEAPKQKNLLTHYAKLELADVRKTVCFYRLYGQDYDLENLQWSQELLEESCEPSLRDKVLEKAHAIPVIEMGGPTFFLIMAQTIMSLTEKSIRGVVQRIHKMKITDFTGEDIDKVVSYLRSARQRLIVVDQLPLDFTTTCLEIFQTSSVPDFNKVFDTIELSLRLGIIKSMETEEIFIQAETRYKELLELQEWNVKKVQQSAFTATKPNKSNITCFKCQQLGHYANDPACPARNSLSDRQAWKRVKPAIGEPLTKVMSNRTFYWCAECNMWVIHKVHLPRAEFEAQRAAQRVVPAYNNNVSCPSTTATTTTLASNPTVAEGSMTNMKDESPSIHFTLGQQAAAPPRFNQFRGFL